MPVDITPHYDVALVRDGVEDQKPYMRARYVWRKCGWTE